MSVAFTREEDVEAAAAHLPDRPISPHANLVTASGLAALEAALTEARAAYAEAKARGDIGGDRMAMARAARDLRYYAARRSSAELAEPQAEPGVVAFGRSVTFEREGGRRQTFRIVGEDEADVAKGSISYVSPLARALMGKSVDETAMLGSAEIAILSVD